MRRIRTAFIIMISVTAALAAAVFFNRIMSDAVISVLWLPGYSAPSGKTVYDPDEDIKITEKGRRLTVQKSGKRIWDLPREVMAQDFLFEDMDHDGEKELMVLCWKRGRFGKHRPTWVTEDEKGWSQHIFIYEIKDMKVVPKWMASDIGMDAATWEFDDGVLSITDINGVVSRWIWYSWGFEKL